METIAIHGLISLYEYPSSWSDEEFKYWFCPTTNAAGQILQPARISDETKRQWLVMPTFENLLTTVGIAAYLTNNSVAGQGSTFPFFQILSVGNGAITGVTRGDTTVAGDAFGTNARKAPASFSVAGFQSTIITNYASGDANGTWTNLGCWGTKLSNGQQATSSAGTGQLNTHAIFNYVKGASAIGVQYVFLLSN